jgi:hypothetical protein
MAYEVIQKLTLITKFRLFDWIVMLFDMKNVTNTFSKTMTEVFWNLHGQNLEGFCWWYECPQYNLGRKLEHLWYAFMRLMEVNLKLNLRKHVFTKTNLAFLSHVMNRDGTHCRNPTLAKCGGEAQHFQSWGFGVLRHSRMFRVRQQGPKNLALRCSWCHWKGLEAQISKMASH